MVETACVSDCESWWYLRHPELLCPSLYQLEEEEGGSLSVIYEGFSFDWEQVHCQGRGKAGNKSIVSEGRGKPGNKVTFPTM